jgi:hypothetical protein
MSPENKVGLCVKRWIAVIDRAGASHRSPREVGYNNAILHSRNNASVAVKRKVDLLLTNIVPIV